MQNQSSFFAASVLTSPSALLILFSFCLDKLTFGAGGHHNDFNMHYVLGCPVQSADNSFQLSYLEVFVDSRQGR